MVLLAARGHDPAAKYLWQTLYNAAKPAIGGVLGDRFVYRDRDAPELLKDLLLEAYEKLWKDNQRGFLGWRPAVGTVDAYIATVAANHTRDVCRKRLEKLDDDDDSRADEASEDETQEERLIRIDVATKTLHQMRASLTTPDEKHMFYLIVELGLPIDEVVNRTGKSPNAVSQRRMQFTKLAEDIRKNLDSDPGPSTRKTSGKKK